MIYYPDHMGYKVRIKDKKGEVFEGILISYGHGYDEEPEVDYDTLGVQPIGTKGYCICIPVTDVEEFKVLD